MILYHYSKGYHQILKNTNKKENGIWFTTSKSGYNGDNRIFRYQIEVSDDDYRLKENEKANEDTNGKIRWYLYNNNTVKYDDVKCLNRKFYPLVNEIIKFRNMIDETDFNSVDEAGCFRNFPRACCGDASLLLWKYIQNKFKGRFDGYICYKNGVSNGCWHAWLEFENNIIIDITADQFKDIEENVLITTNRRFHNRFKENSRGRIDVDYENMNREVKMRLRKLYEAICAND